MLENIISLNKISNNSFIHSYNLEDNYFLITKYNNIVNIYTADNLRLLFTFTVEGENITICNKFIITSDRYNIYIYYREELIKRYSIKDINSIIHDTNNNGNRDYNRDKSSNDNTDNTNITNNTDITDTNIYTTNTITTNSTTTTTTVNITSIENIRSKDNMLFLISDGKTYIFSIDNGITYINTIDYKYYYIVDNTRMIVLDNDIKIIDYHSNNVLDSIYDDCISNELLFLKDNKYSSVLFTLRNNILLLSINNKFIFINLLDRRIKIINHRDINIKNIIDIEFRNDGNELLILSKQDRNILYVYGLEDFSVLRKYEGVNGFCYVLSYIVFTRNNSIYMYDDNLVRKREGVDGMIIDFISHNNDIVVLTDKNIYNINIRREEANFVFSRCRELFVKLRDRFTGDGDMQLGDGDVCILKDCHFINNNLLFCDNRLYLLSDKKIALYFDFQYKINYIGMSICNNFIIFSTKSRVTVINVVSRLVLFEIHEEMVLSVNMCLYNDRIILFIDNELIEYSGKGVLIERYKLEDILLRDFEFRSIFIPDCINKCLNKENDNIKQTNKENNEKNKGKYNIVESTIIDDNIYVNTKKCLSVINLATKELLRNYRISEDCSSNIDIFKVQNDIIGFIVVNSSTLEKSRSYHKIYFYNIFTNKLCGETEGENFEFIGNKIIISKNNNLELFYLTNKNIETNIITERENCIYSNTQNITKDEIINECVELIGFLEYEENFEQ